MRTFAVGFILGVLLCFIATRFIDRPAPGERALVAEPVATRSTSPVATTSAPSCPEIKSVAATPARPEQTKTANVRPEVRTASPEAAAVAKVDRLVSIEDFTDEEAQQLCIQMYRRQQQRERDKKDAEPVDAAWAPSMEMLIRQHVESTLSRKQYSKLDVHCRSSFCELKIAGTDSKHLEQIQKLVQDIANQPWGGSIVNRGSSTTGGETWEVTQEWFRPRTDVELQLWRKNSQN